MDKIQFNQVTQLEYRSETGMVSFRFGYTGMVTRTIDDSTRNGNSRGWPGEMGDGGKVASDSIT